MGVRGAVWFSFEAKSHSELQDKNIRFDLIWLTFKIKSEPNQCSLGLIGCQ